MTKIKKYEFFNIPEEYSIADYKKSTNHIIERYSKINGLVSIYNWGDPSIPGISDIDIVLVFKDNADNPLNLLNRSFYFLDDKTRYLVRHPFIFIDAGSFKKARYIYPNTNFKLLHGKSIKIDKLSPDDEYYSKIALLNDIITRHYPRDFIEQFADKNINIRDTLLRLNSLKYSIKILESLTKEKNARWNVKLRLIENLRKNWFKAKDFNLLVLLNGDAFHITMDIIEKFRIFLIRNNLVNIYYGDKIRYNGIKNKALFIKNWGKTRALQEMLNTIKNKQKFYSILPIELSAQLIEYSKCSGLISSHIRKNISNDIDYQLKYKRVAENRISILNKQAELASKLRHSDFAAFFDFGYRNKHGINNWILSLSDKLRF